MVTNAVVSNFGCFSMRSSIFEHAALIDVVMQHMIKNAICW